MTLFVHHYKMSDPYAFSRKTYVGVGCCWMRVPSFPSVIHLLGSPCIQRISSWTVRRSPTYAVNSKDQSISVCVSKHLITFLQRGWGWRWRGARWWCTTAFPLLLELDPKEDGDRLLRGKHPESGCVLSYTGCPAGERGGWREHVVSGGKHLEI